MEKERDNTWLQLPVCPTVLRPNSSLEKCTHVEGTGNCSFAHPPEHVLRHVLSNGYVVSCQDFVFSHGVNKRGCNRSICKYFHPPTHLRLLVINAGKNNKRLRSEMEERYKRQRAVAGNPTMSAVAATAPLTQLHGYPASAAMDCQQGFLGYNIPGFSWNPNAALATVPLQANAALAASSLPILYHHPSASVAQQQHHFLHQQQLQQPAQQLEPAPPGTGSTSPSRKRSGSSSPQVMAKEKKRSGAAASASVAEDGMGVIASVPVCGDQGGPLGPQGPGHGRVHISVAAAAAAAGPCAQPPPPQQQSQPEPTLHPPHPQQQLPLLDQVAAASYINAVQQQQLLLSQQQSQQHLQPQHSQAVSLGLHNLILYDQYFNYASKFM